MINAHIDFMRKKKVLPKCKILHKDTLTADFVSTEEDGNTMTVEHQVIHEHIAVEHTIREWRANYHDLIRKKNVCRHVDQLNKK